MGSSRGRFGVQVGGQGLGRGHGLGVKVGVKVSGQGQGHDWWTQGQGSRSWGQGQGMVKVMGRGSMSGGLGSDGRWGRLKINSLFLSRTHDRIEFHSIPFHSIPIHSIPIHSIPFHSIPFQSIPFHVLPNAFQKSFVSPLKWTLFQRRMQCCHDVTCSPQALIHVWS